MNLIDAHIHLSDQEYVNYVEELIADAKNANLVALVANSVNLQTSVKTVKLAEKYPSLVYSALGIHPWNVNMLEENELDETVEFIINKNLEKKVLAIGEVGLDSKYETTWDKQLMVFDRMLHLAETLSLPVIIHSRGATEQIINMLPSYNLKRILLHWFSDPLIALSQVISHGYFITEGPPTLYSSGIREVVTRVPITNLLTETDGPVRYYKQPFNGQLTKPSYIKNVVEAIAQIKNLRADKVSEQIEKNFESFFDLKLR